MKKTTNKGGRPPIYGPEQKDSLLRRICEGESVRSICRDEHMPCEWTVYDWLRNQDGFRDDYRLAIEMRAEAMFEEILSIADDPTHDWVERTTKDGSTAVVGDHEHMHRSKLRVDTRKWMLARMVPKKYGDSSKIDLGGEGGGAISYSWQDPVVPHAVDLPEDVRSQIRTIAEEHVRRPDDRE